MTAVLQKLSNSTSRFFGFSQKHHFFNDPNLFVFNEKLILSFFPEYPIFRIGRDAKTASVSVKDKTDEKNRRCGSCKKCAEGGEDWIQSDIYDG